MFSLLFFTDNYRCIQKEPTESQTRKVDTNDEIGKYVEAKNTHSIRIKKNWVPWFVSTMFCMCSPSPRVLWKEAIELTAKNENVFLG